MSVKRYTYKDGEMVTPLPRGHRYSEESISPEEVDEWVTAKDYDKAEELLRRAVEVIREYQGEENDALMSKCGCEACERADALITDIRTLIGEKP